MCGRTACTLDPDIVPYACTKVTKDAKVPKYNKSGKYRPSTNVAPTSYTPILLNNHELGNLESEKSDMVLQDMMWGLIPPWYQGEDPTKHGLSTNNARLEGITSSKLYKQSLDKNRRCAVICSGFYEWKALEGDKKSKQPYLVYVKQDKGKMITNQEDTKLAEVWANDQYSGETPLFMAGVYSKWQDKLKDETVYSYSIVTRDSSGVLDWLHDRMPVILTTKEAVSNWLDPEFDGNEAVNMLKQISKDQLSSHPVSRLVGNSREKSKDLMEPVDLDSKGLAKEPMDKSSKRSADMMSQWLTKKPKK